MRKMICFDMDGTLADTYNIPGWLQKLRNEDPSPYEEAEPLLDMAKLNETVSLLKQAGWEIAVITWLSKQSTPEFKEATRQAKRKWLKKWGFIYDHFHGVAYGTTKADCVRHKADEAILIDDDSCVRSGWALGATINPAEEDIIQKLLEIAGA